MAFPGRQRVVGWRMLYAPLCLAWCASAALAGPTFTVDTNRDVSDPNDGRTSLREAIILANARPLSEGDVLITFDPTVFTPNPGLGWNHVGGFQTGDQFGEPDYYNEPDNSFAGDVTNDPNRIVVGAVELADEAGYDPDATGFPKPLPTITRSQIRIDGELDNNGQADVRIDLTDLAPTWVVAPFPLILDRSYGIRVSAANDVVIEGLDIRFGLLNSTTVRSSVVGVWFAAGTDHRVVNCELMNNAIGCQSSSPAPNNVFIGGPSPGSDNTISGNQFAGIYCRSSGQTTIQNNTSISSNGTATDTDSGADYSGGIVVEETATALIGGTIAGTSNGINHNTTHGIVLAGSGQCFVQNNTIDGSNRSGVYIFGSANNIIGGSATLSGNVITNNGDTAGPWNHAGIQVAGTGANTIQGNYIGISRDGGVAGNGGAGIHITGSGNNRIGGTAVAARNFISSNGDVASSESKSGVLIAGSGNNVLENNHIGTNPAGTAASANTTHGVEIDGSGSNTIGGTQTNARNVISGNALNGIRLAGVGANIITGNYIGLGADGSTDVGNSSSGMEIAATASGANRIGGTSDGERNVISGNGAEGVTVNGSGNNVFYNNYIGLASDGLADRGNGRHGVAITSQAIGRNTIGGRAPGQRNVVSGNGQFGLSIDGTAGQSNIVRGNYVGVNAVAAGAVGNAFGGLSVNASQAQIIGGTELGDGNVIAGNSASTSADGIELLGTGAHIVIGNVIGAVPVNPTGFPQDYRLDAANQFRNGGAGILIGGGATGNVLIGTDDDPAVANDDAADGASPDLPPSSNEINAIVNNGLQGIQIASSGNVTVVNSMIGIGPDASGQFVAMANASDGVLISGDGSNKLGSDEETPDNTLRNFYNVISGNGDNGVSITGPGANLVVHNLIGTDPTALAARANGSSTANDAMDNGVAITGSGANVVRDNTISGNANHGVYLFGSGTYTLRGNSIGLNLVDRAGAAALPNGGHGVFVPSNAPGRLVLGGSGANDFNVISGNTLDGLHLEGNVENDVERNRIGTNGAGTAAVPNGTANALDAAKNAGVYLQGGSATDTELLSNLISGNEGHGVKIVSGFNSLFRNFIGTNAAGSAAVPNTAHGIYLSDPNLPTERKGQVIGRLAAGNVRESNIVSGNAGDGIHIVQAGGDDQDGAGDDTLDDIKIHTNLIGVDSTGLLAIANGGDGIEIAATATGRVHIGDRTDSTGTFVDGQGNVISGNSGWGIRYEGAFNNTVNNAPVVYGNLIGTDGQGVQALANGAGGVFVNVAAGGAGATERVVTIGGVRPPAGAGFPFSNLISGNGGPGLSLTGTASFKVFGNFVGSDAFARRELPNTGDGITIAAAADGPLFIGKDNAGTPVAPAVNLGRDRDYRNVVTSSSANGINSAGTGFIAIVNNYVGAGENTATGSVSLFDTGGGNDQSGLTVGNAAAVTATIASNDVYRSGTTGINLAAPGTGRVDDNIIQASTSHGLVLNGTGAYTVVNNRISANGGNGIHLAQASNATVGASATDATTGVGLNPVGNGINYVQDNVGDGIVQVTGTGNRLSANVINGNGVVAGSYNGSSLGIDISDDGPSPANGLRIGRVTNDGTNWTVSGTVPSGTAYLELYQALDPDVVAGSSTPRPDADTANTHRGQVRQLIRRLSEATDGDSATDDLDAAGGTFVYTFPVATTAGTVDAQVLFTALTIDNSNNTSEFARNTGLPSLANSTVQVSSASLQADGQPSHTVTVTATVRDAIDTPLEGLTPVVITWTPQPTEVTVSQTNNVTDSNGQVRATVSASSRPNCTDSALTFGATYNGAPFTHPTAATAGLSLVSGPATAAQSSISAAPSGPLTADGVSEYTLTITVADPTGCPIGGVAADRVQVVDLSSPGGQVQLIQPTAATATASGRVGQTTALARATAAGTYTVGFEVDGVQAVDGGGNPKTVTLTFGAGAIDAAGSTLTASPATVLANGSDPVTLTLSLVDANGNPVTGVASGDITIAAQPATGLAPSPIVLTEVAGQPGTYQGTVTGTVPGDITFAATARGVVINSTVTVPFTVGQASANSTLTADPLQARPNGTDTVTLTVTIRDAANNPVPGVDVTIQTVQGTGVTVVGPNTPTNAAGVTTATVTATQPGRAVFEARALVGGNPVPIRQVAVDFRLLDPDPAQSTVTLTQDDPLLANGQRRATVAVRVVDAQGGPLPGINPNEFEITATLPGGATGLLVVGPDEATNTNGETSFTVSSTTPGTASISVRARNVALNQTVQATFLPYITQSYGPGLHLMGIAGNPTEPDPRDVLAQLLPGLRLARWQAGEQRLRVWNEFEPTAPFAMAAGRGFWLQLTSATSFTAVGAPTPLAPFTMPLARGWNQVANPYPATYPFRLRDITVLQNGAPVGTLDQAAAQALVEPYGWRWDPVLQYLLLLDPATNAAASINGDVALGRGWWWLCRADNVSVVLEPASAARARLTRAAATPGNWSAAIEATTAEGAAQAILGAGSSRLRAEVPPAAPLPTPVKLVFTDSQGRAASDVRVGPFTTRQRWDLAVETATPGEVTLTWQGVSRALPAGHKLWLTDPTNGRRLLLNSTAAYTYQGEAGVRQFKLELDPRGQRTLNIVGLTAGAGRGRGRAVALTLTLTAEADLTVTVRGAGGRLVKQWTLPGSEGSNPVDWDGRDASGRPVPAGTYQVEVTARGAEGELARAVRTVAVR